MPTSSPYFQLPALLRGWCATSAQLAADLGTSPANVTNLTHAKNPQRASPELVAAMSQLPAADGRSPAVLVLAHLHDELVRARVDPTQYFIYQTSGVDFSQLVESSNGHLGIIARAAERDPEIAEILQHLAHTLMVYEASLADVRGAAEKKAENVLPFAAESKADQYEATPDLDAKIAAAKAVLPVLNSHESVSGPRRRKQTEQ